MELSPYPPFVNLAFFPTDGPVYVYDRATKFLSDWSSFGQFDCTDAQKDLDELKNLSDDLSDLEINDSGRRPYYRLDGIKFILDRSQNNREPILMLRLKVILSNVKINDDGTLNRKFSRIIDIITVSLENYKDICLNETGQTLKDFSANQKRNFKVI